MINIDREIEAKYEVLAAMGEGGMGSVYKVRHRHLDEIRVIKLMREKYRADENLTARFLREAKTAVKLRHPNIAEVIDYDVTSAGTAFIVMEFIEGVDLREIAARSVGVMRPDAVVDIAGQTLSALGYLHEKGFIHRDISPDNIMVTERDGRPVVKLIDLGIAKSVEASRALTADGHFIGKVQYASPEQLGGGEIDQRSDLYSLGVMMYELLTGTTPITGSDYKAIIAGHIGRPPRSFQETDPKGRVPASLRRVILKALEKDPDRRYSNADAFARALQSAATTDPDDELSERATQIAALPAPSKKFVWAAVPIGLVALAIAAVWLWPRAQTVALRPASIPVAQTGEVVLKGLPWAEVMEVVDASGRNHVVARPLYTPAVLALPPGPYRVRFSNPLSGRELTVQTEVKPLQSVVCNARLDDIDAATYLRQAP